MLGPVLRWWTGRAPGEPPETETSRRNRVVIAVAAAGFLLAVVAIALLRPAGPLHADATEHIREFEPLPLVVPGKPLEQHFTADANGLSEVTLRFGTFGHATDCAIRITLTRGDTTVAERRVDCTDIPDSVLFRALQFAPQPNSNGADYVLRIATDGDGPRPVTVWGGPPNGDVPAATSGTSTLRDAMELHTGYGGGGTFVSDLGTVLRRMSQYGPFWGAPWFVVLLVVGSLAALVATLAVAPRKALVFLLLFAALKGVFWSVLVPPLEGVDEPAHIAYVQFMAEQHRIPRRGSAQFDIHNPISAQLATMIEDTHQELPGPGDRPDFGSGSTGVSEHDVDHLSPLANGDAAAAGYSPAYYLPAAAFYDAMPGSLFDKIAATRLWSVVLGVITMWLTVLIGRRLFPSSPLAPLLLGIAVSAQPMMSQQFSIVNNDALVITMGAASLLMALELLAGKSSRRTLLLAGLSAGGAVLAKPFGAVCLPLVGLAWLVGRYRTRGAATSKWWRDIVQLGTGVFATYGVWYAATILFNFPPPKLQANSPIPGRKSLADFIHILRLNNYGALRANWVDQFWGNFSWVDVPLPGWVHGVIIVAELAGIAAFLVWLLRVTADAIALRRSKGWLAASPERRDLTLRTLTCAALVAGTLALLYIIAFLQYRLTGRNDLIQGRYALMAAPALLALPALFVRRFTPRVDPAVPLAFIAAAMIALNVFGVGLLVDRFYL